MKEKPIISVVTIVWNDAEGFLVTANSVLKQSYKNIEWIVIDGNSKDGTSNYIKQLAPAISSYLIEDDTGIYNAMNKGIDLATGDWIIFMNADDVFFDENTVSDYVNNILPGDNVLYSDVIRREDGVVHQYREPSQYWAGMTFDHQSAFIQAELYKKFKYDEQYRVAGDLNFISILHHKGYNFRKVDGMISCIKPFGVGASSSYFDRQFERVKVLRTYFDSDILISLFHREFDNAFLTKSVTDSEYEKLLTFIGKSK